MIVTVDANILFSALITLNGRIAKIRQMSALSFDIMIPIFHTRVASLIKLPDQFNVI